MSLTLHMHPLSSYCIKVVTAFYETGLVHDKAMVDLGDPASAARFRALWPMGLMPVLEDVSRGKVMPESSVIIEYAELNYAGPVKLIPHDPVLALETRLWDRFSDYFVMTPMQKIVTDNLRPEGSHDPFGVGQARETLRKAYAQLEARLTERTWVMGDFFSLADCALAPALWYANKVEPLNSYRSLDAYLNRLIARPSFARALEEAKPYLHNFPA